MTKQKKTKVALTIGDYNGIGIEVIMKALSDNRIYEHCTPVIYGNTGLIRFQMRAMKLEEIQLNTIKSAEDINPNKVNVIDVWSDKVSVEFGKPNKQSGQYSYLSLKAAVEDLASTKVDVLVTAPIDKQAIQSNDFDFKGHTEYLADYSNEDHPLMILTSDDLRVALVTGHVAVTEVASHLNQDLIVKKLETFSKSLQQDFEITKPRIAVLGLNPHNGDQGLMGQEESEIIRPAIEQAIEQKILAFGPYPADGFFGSDLRSKFDGILAMYHDQGLAPFKAISFDNGVNFTAGLPIVRTSPDHGVAADIAGKGIASASSLRSSIYYALDIHSNRKSFRSLASNPLKISKKNRRDKF